MFLFGSEVAITVTNQVGSFMKADESSQNCWEITGISLSSYPSLILMGIVTSFLAALIFSSYIYALGKSRWKESWFCDNGS